VAKKFRKCAEPGCDNPLGSDAPSTRKTCSDACRAKRSRRIKAQRKKAAQAAGDANALPAHLRPLSERVVDGRAAKDAAHEVLKEELRPVVRERLTEEVLDGIGGLVDLVPAAIARIQEDLDSDDPKIRQTAYNLIMRYTMGNSSVAPAPAEQAPAPMQVIFQMPRPGDTTPEANETAQNLDGTPAKPSLLGEAEELRACQECGVEQPVSAFVANSERCSACHEAIQERVRARFENQ